MNYIFDNDPGPITVSTLKEAELFFDAGAKDILYAVGITASKLGRVLDLAKAGADIKIIVDNLASAKAIKSASQAAGVSLPTLIEVDVDGHRSGVCAWNDKALVDLATALGDENVAGVLTHAGGSYGCKSRAELAEAAESERSLTVAAADILRDAGFAAPIVSIGSTPTASSMVQLDGVSEVRAGVFMFFDLVMAGLNVCGLEDIALSVLTTVIGHQSEKGWIIVDAGWMAMSRDRGTSQQSIDQGYGVVCDASGRILDDLIMTGANQEHGVLAIRPGSNSKPPNLPVGTQLRILPNHACATAAQHNGYHTVRGPALSIEGYWPRFSGW